MTAMQSSSQWGNASGDIYEAPYSKHTDALPFDLTSALRELIAQEPRMGERSISFSRQILHTLFLNEKLDLCAITPQHPSFETIQGLTHANSPFFETFFNGSDKEANDLWRALYEQVQRSQQYPSVSRESVLLKIIGLYVVRLLPTERDQDSALSLRVPSVSQQRVHTPLDLFLPSSPVLSRVRLDDSMDRAAASSPHPRHVTKFCNLVFTMCSTNDFPSQTRLIVLRYLMKQFHTFCLYTTTDKDLNSVKAAVLLSPPFADALYDFLATFIEQTPSFHSLDELAWIWLAFCRPWRYSTEILPENDPRAITSSLWFPFVRRNQRFYRHLLAKIFRRIGEMDVTLESLKLTKAVSEWAFSDPPRSVLSALALDARPSVKVILDRIAEVAKRKKCEIASQEKQSFWETLTNVGDSPRITAARDFVNIAESILSDGDRILLTSYVDDLHRFNRGSAHAQPLPSSSISAPQLTETPKRGYLPDHDVDPITGLLYLTPTGAEQVIRGERKFDFHECFKVIPRWMQNPDFHECSFVVSFLQWLAPILSKTWPVRELGNHYLDNGPLGTVSRTLLDPPFPNPRAFAVSPIYSNRIRKTPPTLKLRILADYRVLSLIVFLLLFKFFHWLVPVGLVLFAVIGLVGISAANEV